MEGWYVIGNLRMSKRRRGGEGGWRGEVEGGFGELSFVFIDVVFRKVFFVG